MSVLTLEMNPAEAELLQKLGLLQELRSVFKFDLNIQVTHTGLQVSVPVERKSMICYLDAYIQHFRKQVLSENVPLHVKKDVLYLPAVRKGLVRAIDNKCEHAVLEVDKEKCALRVFARSREIIQKVNQIVENILIESEIDINRHIKIALSQDARFCEFQESDANQLHTIEFTLAIQERAIMITGLKEAVIKAEKDIVSLIHNLESYIGRMKEARKMAYGQQVSLTETEDYHKIKVAVPIKSHDVFSYIKTFYTTFEGVDLIAYEAENKQEFILEGTPADVETVEKPFREMVNHIVDKRITFQDDGYFSNNAGQQFIEDKLEKDCQVLCKTHSAWDKMADGQNQGRERLTPMTNEINGHNICSWKIDDKRQIALVESKVDEISADVIVNIMDMKDGGKNICIFVVLPAGYMALLLSSHSSHNDSS